MFLYDCIPVQHTTWLDWKTRHPDSLVLSTDTGYKRNYRNSPAEFTETVNSLPIIIRYDSNNRTASITDQHGKQFPGVRTFWFAWYAFHPKTEVYVAP